MVTTRAQSKRQEEGQAWYDRLSQRCARACALLLLPRAPCFNPFGAKSKSSHTICTHPARPVLQTCSTRASPPALRLTLSACTIPEAPSKSSHLVQSLTHSPHSLLPSLSPSRRHDLAPTRTVAYFGEQAVEDHHLLTERRQRESFPQLAGHEAARRAAQRIAKIAEGGHAMPTKTPLTLNASAIFYAQTWCAATPRTAPPRLAPTPRTAPHASS